MSDRTVYLAGPVAALDDGGAGWRDDVIAEFDAVQFTNPLDQYNAPAAELTITDGAASGDATIGVGELVESDKSLLRESDGVLVGYTDVKSVGTPMEVMWAYEREMPVAVWLRDGTGAVDLSPWYRHHATAITGDLGTAIRHLRLQARGDTDE